jgi:UDP-sugar transporter A1/2/3
MYSSLLNNPSSTMTHLSLAFMMLLAVQYALQPRLSRRYISPKVNKQSVALVEELVKTGMAAAIFLSKPRPVVQQAMQGKIIVRNVKCPQTVTCPVSRRFHQAHPNSKCHLSSFSHITLFLFLFCACKDWSLSSSLTVAGLPAMLYAMQGVLQYVSHQHLDPVTFNGLTQTKTLSAALCCWIIMGKAQSPLQMVALGILFVSAMVFQGYISFGGTGSSAVSQTTTRTATTMTMKTKQQKEDWVWKGIVPCLGAAFTSGLAGALSQKGLQLTGIAGRDPFLYTVEISFFSAVTLFISMLRSNSFSKMEWDKQRAHWNYKTLIPIVCKAAGGVVTALVHKYAGSVAKGFALMFGLVLSSTLQMTLSKESLQPHQVTGTLLIMLSTWLHFTHPSV